MCHRGGPALIQVDGAYLVHKDGSREKMSVSIEDRRMDGMYGAAHPTSSYNKWKLPSNVSREKLEDLPKKGIRQSEIRVEDVILDNGGSWHVGTRHYHQEGMDKLSLPRSYGWRGKAAKDVVASVRARPGRFLRKDPKRRGIYYDVGDEKAKDAADMMIANFSKEGRR